MDISVPSSARILITFIGMGNYTPTEYFIFPNKERTYPSRISGIAIANLAESYDAIIVLATAQSEELVPGYEEALAKNSRTKKCKLIPHRVSEGTDKEDILSIVSDLVQIIEEVRSNNQSSLLIDIDITHAFRHLPMLYFAAMSFLSTFRDAKLGKVYYGRFEKEVSLTPIVDVSAAFNFILWSQAVQSFVESGRVDMLTSLLKDLRMDYRYSKDTSRRLHDIEKALRGLIHPLSHALPLEIGTTTACLLKRLEDINETSCLSPALTHLFNEIGEELRPLSSFEGLNKADYTLTSDELNRQLAIVEWFHQRGRIGDALLLLREFFVNVMMLNEPERWLETETRQAIDRKISILASLRTDNNLRGMLTQDQQELAEYWDSLRQLRNIYAHAGFTIREIRLTQHKDTLDGILSYCKTLQPIPLGVGGSSGKMLICPLGLSKGSLYTALVKMQPDTLIVLASDDTEELLHEVLVRAGFASEHTMVIKLHDPYLGFNEIKRVTSENRLTLVRSSEVHCCVTGGTTLMVEAVRALAADAKRMGVNTQVFALIDRRPIDAQRTDPFVLGELVALDTSPDSEEG